MSVFCSTVIAWSLVVALSPQQPAVLPDQALPPPSAPAASTSTPLRLTGRLESYDAKTRSVSVRTSTGVVRLLLTAESRVRQGRQAMDAEQLDRHLGARVVLRYAESATAPAVLSLRLMGSSLGSP